MNKEIQYIRKTLQQTLTGKPWYGRALFEVLGETDPAKVYQQPGGKAHSLIELLYHMITWSEFTRAQLEMEGSPDVSAFEKLDWRPIDPSVHTWEKGMQALKESNDRILMLLEEKNDDLLGNMVEGREYNFRFLLQGLIQHHIYHEGQVVCVQKLFA
ncbi:MAG TPA: DinB family protein [Puia sp.]|nr:DinB family protein [Puia sp.]